MKHEKIKLKESQNNSGWQRPLEVMWSNPCSKQSSHQLDHIVHSLNPSVYNASKDGNSMQNH